MARSAMAPFTIVLAGIVVAACVGDDPGPSSAPSSSGGDGGPTASSSTSASSSSSGSSSGGSSGTSTSSTSSTSTSSGSSVTVTRKRVFVSSWAGNAELGGVAMADGKCNDLAQAASIGNTYKAWLSDGTSSPATRFSPHPANGWQRLDGVAVANDWNDLIDGTLLAGIDRDEHGVQVTKDAPVWTNTDTTGGAWLTNYACDDWTKAAPTSSAAYSYVGRVGEQDGSWTLDKSGNTVGCSGDAHLYCFEL